MGLRPRAAAIRGDHYQHAVGWYWACEMLADPDIDNVTIEDPSAGSFDDVVVRRRSGTTRYIQVKSSNYGNVVVDQEWLLTSATAKGRSPLQHFHDTYLALRSGGRPFTLELWTNRGFDHTNPLLGELLDQKHDRIDTARLTGASPTSRVGAQRDAWATHLGIGAAELAEFLDCVLWKQTGSELDWRQRAKPLMKLSGLRSDDEAVQLGVGIVHSWVTDGRGTQTTDDVRREVAQHGLLARDGALLLAVHGIDRDPTATQPNLELDFVDLYIGDDSFSRKQLRNPLDWDDVVRPAIDGAARALAAYGVRHVHIVGALRHPMWFAVGRALPQVKKWVLSMEQVNAEWRTDADPEPIAPRRMAYIDIGQGADLAFAVGLTGDPTQDVEGFIRASGMPVGRLLVLGPPGTPGVIAVPSDGWAMGWTRATREIVRAEANALNSSTVHAFFLCPAGIALMLGYQWNLMPPTVLYEFVGNSYEPTISVPGT